MWNSFILNYETQIAPNMNRIIVIGNGFDMAHNLKTGYRDFINGYWDQVMMAVFDDYSQWLIKEFGACPPPNKYEDNLVAVESKFSRIETSNELFDNNKCDSFGEFYKLIEFYNNNDGNDIGLNIHLNFKNQFFKHITTQCSLKNWVDIENEYYDALKKLLLEEDVNKRSHEISTLNNEFDAVKRLLEKYLNEVVEKSEIVKHQSVQDAFSSSIEYDEIATCKQKMFIDSIFSKMPAYPKILNEYEKEKRTDPTYNYLTPDMSEFLYLTKKTSDTFFTEVFLTPRVFLLNFNYTKTAEKLYIDYCKCPLVINIHGELNNEKNPIIFGYGDELDDDYRKIEKLQDNNFLENIKSIEYHKTRNYRDLLRFIQYGPYQVFTMGHSCGNSDRTLLNTLFEHDNCVSIKVFYQQFENGGDDYINLIKNISRNFNNKPLMRDIIVNREDCSPLVPVAK